MRSDFVPFAAPSISPLKRPARRFRPQSAPPLLGTLIAVAFLLLAPLMAQGAERDFAIRYTRNVTGDIYLIGNTGMTCSPTGTNGGSCTAPAFSSQNDDYFTMMYANGTGTSSTSQSTSAALAMPAGSTVLWAGLYWQGDSSAAGRGTVTLQTPSGSGAISASQLDTLPGQGCGGSCSADRYNAFADVTALVQAGGNGSYTVSGIQGSPNNANTFSGWGLIVAFQNSTLPLRNLTVFDGYKGVTTTANNNPTPNPDIFIPVSGFITPYSGPVNTTLGVIAGEGDMAITGDSFSLNGTTLSDAAHPGNNFFTSVISNLGSNVSAKNPNYTNQLGWDIARVNASNILPNGATSASIHLSTTQDWYYPSAVSFVTDLYVPIITPNVSKTASDVNGGYLLPGDTLRFTINLGNTGYDTATNVVLTDNIPAWTTYKPGSLQILSGAGSGAKTDGSGDDQAEYVSSGTPHVVFRLGAGANGSTGGTLAQNEFTSASFDVTVNADIPGGTTINNTAQITNNGQTITSTNYSSASNPVQVGVLTPPSVSNSFSPNPVDIGGVSTMTIQLTNPAANMATLTGVSFNDVYPAGMVNDVSPNPTITCSAGSTPGSIVGGVAGANSIGMSGATIAQNGSCTLTVRIKSSLPQQGNYTNNTGPITTSNAGIGPGGSATFSVGGATIAESFTPALILKGNSSTASFTITNPTSVALTGTAFSDLLPAGLQVASGSTSNGCGGTLSAAVGGSAISLSGGTVAAASSGQPGSCTVTLPVTATQSGYFTNSSSGVSSTQTPTAGPGSNVANLTVLDPVTAATSFSPSSISSGSGVSQLSVTISNPNAANPLGNSTVTGVQFTDSYPANLVNSGVAPSPVLTCSSGSSGTLTGGSAGGNSIGLSGGTLAPGGSCTVTVNVTSASAANYTNSTGAISTGNAGTGAAASAVLNVSALTPPTVSTTFTSGTILAGQNSTMSVLLSNRNASAITGVSFSDNYPTGLLNSATPGVTNSCGGTLTTAANGSSLLLSGGTIPANGSCSITVQTTAASPGGYTNIIPTVLTANAGTAGQTSGTLNVMGPPVITKSFSPNAIRSGTGYYSTLTLTVSNPGSNPIALTGVAFTDSYPAGLRNYGTPNATLSCSSGSSANLTGGAANGTTVGMSGGAIEPGGNCTISVRVTSTAAGVYTNSTGSVTSTNGGTGSAASDLLSTGGIGITKSFGAATIAAGGTTTMTIVLTNGTGNNISNAAFSDSYPAGLTNASSGVLVSNSCGGTFTAPANGSSLSLSGGSVAKNGGSCSITVNVSASASISNSIAAGAFTGGGNSNAEVASANLAVYPVPTVAASFTPSSIAYTQASLATSSLLTITLSNPNDFDATGVAFTDTYPAGLLSSATPAAVSSCGGTVTAAANGNTLSLTGGTIPANDSCTVTVNVTSKSAGSYGNSTGPVTTANAGTGAAAAAMLTVLMPTTAAMAFAPPVIGSNDSSRLTITLTNPNAVDVTGAAFADSYPAGLVNTAAPGGATTCVGGVVGAAAGSSSLSLASATIPANGSCTVSVNVTSAATGSYTNSTGAITTGNASSAAPASAVLSVSMPAPTVTKTFSPGQVTVNGSSTLSVTLTNPNATAITGVAFGDSYPSGLLNGATPGVTNSCGGTVTALAGAGSLTLTGGVIPANGSCSVTVNVSAAAAGGYTNNITGVSSSNAGTSGPASAALVVVLSAPTATESFNPAAVAPNAVSLLTVTLTNPSATAITGASFTDSFPTGLVNGATPNATTTCSGGTVTAAAGGTTLALTGATIPGNSSCTVTVNVSSATPGSYLNSTGLIASGNASLGSAATATLTVSGAALTKSFTPSTLVTGQSSTLSFTITNGSGNPAQSGLAFTDTLPAGVNLSGTATSSQCGGTLSYDTVSAPNRIIFSGGSLASGVASCSISATVTSAAAGSYTNNSSNITALAGGLSAAGANATLTVIPPATLAASFAPGSFVAGQSSTLSFTITNGSGNPAQSGLSFSDTLPAGLTLSGTALSPQCGGTLSYSGGNSITLTGATLAAGTASCTVTVTVTGATPGSYSNTSANVSGVTGGVVTSGVNATVTVIPAATLGKAFTPASISAFSTSTVSFTITNGSGNPAQSGLAFTDTLPAGLALSGTATASQCGGTLSYDTSSSPNRIIFSGGSLAAGSASCTVNATVTTSTPGSYNNASANLSGVGGGLLTSGVNATLTVQAPSPSLSKLFSPSTIVAGQSSTVSFTIANGAGNLAQSGLAFTDTLPAAVLLSGSATLSQCGGTLSYDTSSSPNKINFTGGSLANGVASCTITATVTSASAGSYTNASGNIGNLGGNLIASGVNATLTVIPPAALTKAFAPATIVSGQSSTLTFTISNGSGNPAQSGLGFSDLLPAGVTLSGTATSPQCGGTLSYSGGNTVNFAGGSLAAGVASCTITATVTSATPGSYTNSSANVSGVTGGMATSGVNATLTVIAPATLSKVFKTTSIGVGMPSVLSFTITNGSGNPAQSGLAFTDTLPAGVNLSGTASSPQCGGTLRYDTSSSPNRIILSGGTLAAGAASCTVTATVTAPAAGSYVNGAGNLSGLAGGLLNGVSDQTLTVTGSSLSKGFSPATIGVGQSSTLSFTIANGSGNPAQGGLSFTDTLPAGVTLTGVATSSQCGGTLSYIGTNVVSFSGGSLAAGAASCTVTATVTASAAGSYVNGSGNLSGLSAGMANGVSDQTLTVAGSALTKVFAPSTIVAGQSSTVTFTIANGSGNPAQSGLSFTDTLPAGVTLSGSATSPQCGGTVSYSGGNTIALSGGTLAAGVASCTITATVSAASGGSYLNNSANVSGLGGGLTAAGVSALLTVKPAAALTKSFTPASIAAGFTSTVTFTITNGTGNPAQSGLGFTDTLPANVTLYAAPAASQCGGTVSGTVGSNVITLSGGSLAAGTGSCTVSATVISSIAGSYSNTSANVSSLSGGLTAGGVNATLTVSTGNPNLTKAFSPAAIGVGQSSTLTFTVTNASGNPVQSGLGFKDTLPAGVSFSGSAVTPQCGGTVSYSGGNVLTFSGGSLAAGTASCTITTTVTSAATGSYTNNASNISNLAGSLQSAGISATLTVSGTALTNSFAPAQIGVGLSSTLTFAIVNGSGAPAQSGLSFTDTLPSGLTLSGTPTSPQCGGTVSYGGAGNNVVSFSGGSLPGGSSGCSITVTVTSSTAGSYSNAGADMSALSTGMSYSGSATLTVLDPPTVTSLFGTSPIGPGGVSTLTITLSNANSTGITGVAFTDIFPNAPGQMMVAATPNLNNSCGGTASTPGNNQLLLAGAAIPGNSSCTVQVNVTAPVGGSYTNNTGSVSTGNAGSGTSSSAVLKVSAATLTKAFGVASLVGGTSTTLSFTIANGSGNPLQGGLAFTDTMPANITVTGAAASQCGGTVSFTANSVALSGGTLAAGAASCTITATVTSSDAGTWINGNSNIGGVGGGLLNGVTDQSLNVYLLPLLSTTKTADKTQVTPGSVVTYTAVQTNQGMGAATNVVLTDVMSPYSAFSLNSYGLGQPFSFSDGTPPSGLSLGSYTFSSDNGVSWGYLPVSGGGGAPAGYDGNITNWQLIMNGIMNPSASFSVSFKALVR